MSETAVSYKPDGKVVVNLEEGLTSTVDGIFKVLSKRIPEIVDPEFYEANGGLSVHHSNGHGVEAELVFYFPKTQYSNKRDLSKGELEGKLSINTGNIFYDPDCSPDEKVKSTLDIFYALMHQVTLAPKLNNGLYEVVKGKVAMTIAKPTVAHMREALEAVKEVEVYLQQHEAPMREAAKLWLQGDRQIRVKERWEREHYSRFKPNLDFTLEHFFNLPPLPKISPIAEQMQVAIDQTHFDMEKAIKPVRNGFPRRLLEFTPPY